MLQDKNFFGFSFEKVDCFLTYDIFLTFLHVFLYMTYYLNHLSLVTV